MKKSTKAFTLIELLIVIALLGALAIGLLAALDPFEQFKKGRDTGIRNTVSELHGGFIRYYAIKNEMPYLSTISGTGETNSAYIQSVVDTGELKTDFMQLAEDQLQYIELNGGTETLTTCFQPQSKSFRSDPNTKFTATGGTATGCPSSTATTCYWCIR